MDLPSTPPFAIRARLLTPLEAGSTLHESDGLVVVDAAGRIEFAGPADHVDERGRAVAQAALDFALGRKNFVGNTRGARRIGEGGGGAVR